MTRFTFELEYRSPFLCDVDPVSATILALGTAAGGAAAGTLPSLISGGGATPPPPTAAPPPAPPIQQPSGAKAGGAATAQSPQASFVGASSLPQQSGYGQKSLLGN